MEDSQRALQWSYLGMLLAWAMVVLLKKKLDFRGILKTEKLQGYLQDF